jgi:hypothetical protein
MFQSTRRSLLTSCSLVIGGAQLANVLRLRAAEPQRRRRTSVIFVTLGGGASQFETFDPKPAAPAEYRGEFASIATRLPGFQFCELLPKLARISDRLAVVRSIHHEQASHIAEHIVETGYDLVNGSKTREGDMPSVGSAVSRLRGVGESGIPAYVSLPRHHAYSSPHWIGAQHHFFAVDGDPNELTFAVNNLALTDQLTANRLRDRRDLQAAFGKRQKLADLNGSTEVIDLFSQQAFDLITGSRAREAFLIQAEDPRLRDRYGHNAFGQRLLLARRLVEADVPFVTVRTFDWDDHADLPRLIKARVPMFDTGVSALIEDLQQRGLDHEVLVVAMGEFGRTPRINGNRGRDHYPAVNSVLLSGGNYQMGQVIGATDQNGIAVSHAPYRPQNVLAMVYHHLGIDPATTFKDYSGRPRSLLEERGLINELI